MEIFAVRDLTFTYPEQAKPVLDHISFTVNSGEFVTLVGPSGCGKTSLLRQFKTALTPHGDCSGDILFEGHSLGDTSARIQASRIGFVQQNPDNQAVTDKVWHELAFGLESLGYDTPAIRGRVAEIASFFGIQTWFYKNVSDLSGGQKQLLNLAAVMVMQPSVLILDEPSGQLDPIAASNFLAMLGKINRELGTTVILTEHRLEEVFPLSTRVLVMDGGRLICDAPPAETGKRLKDDRHSMFLAMPTPMRVWAAVNNDLPCPITVREGRRWLDEYSADHHLLPEKNETHTAAPSAPELSPTGSPAVDISEAWFRYEKDGPDVIKGLSVKAYPGELLCIIGGNGTGKTTTLSLISGTRRPYRGGVKTSDGLIAALPQNPQTLFVKKSVREDLIEMLPSRARQSAVSSGSAEILSVARLCRIESLLDRHPYDLSGGEQQRAALAKVLLLRPNVLLLDEPTKGLDAEFKLTFAAIVRSLIKNGICVIMVSHDIEFCAEYADRCALFFDGNIVTENTPKALFAQNSFYTTSASRMARHLLPDAVTAEDIVAACGGKAGPPLEDIDLNTGADYFEAPRPSPAAAQNSTGKLPLWRKVLAGLSGAAALGAFIAALKTVNLTEILSSGGLGKSAGGYKTIYLVLLVSLIVFALCVSRRTGERHTEKLKAEKSGSGISKRTAAAMVMIIIAVPMTIFAGVYFLDDRKYYFISLLVILETMLPFVLIFEGRKPQARELVIIAVLCALGVVSRGAFIALPAFKPVTAMVIIAGVAFSGETGFLVGAMTMLVSNMLFGQGPWTPWQMFAMGIIGFLAGVLFKKGVLRRDRLSLSIFGALMALIVYGGIMDSASVVMYQSNPTWQMFLTSYAVGFPLDLVHAASTAIFLWLISTPMLEKLDRIKVKYGLIDQRLPTPKKEPLKTQKCSESGSI